MGNRLAEEEFAPDRRQSESSGRPFDVDPPTATSSWLITLKSLILSTLI